MGGGLTVSSWYSIGLTESGRCNRCLTVDVYRSRSRSGLLRSTLAQTDSMVYSLWWSPDSNSVCFTSGKDVIIKPVAPQVRLNLQPYILTPKIQSRKLKTLNPKTKTLNLRP